MQSIQRKKKRGGIGSKEKSEKTKAGGKPGEFSSGLIFIFY